MACLCLKMWSTAPPSSNRCSARADQPPVLVEHTDSTLTHRHTHTQTHTHTHTQTHTAVLPRACVRAHQPPPSPYVLVPVDDPTGSALLVPWLPQHAAEAGVATVAHLTRVELVNVQHPAVLLKVVEDRLGTGEGEGEGKQGERSASPQPTATNGSACAAHPHTWACTSGTTRTPPAVAGQGPPTCSTGED